MKLRICGQFAIAICVFGCFGSVRTPAQNTASLALRSGAATVQEKVLWSFCSKGGSRCTDGYQPVAGLIMDGSGHLYGTTIIGGATGIGGGTVFELTPNAARTEWTETVLHSFCANANCTDGDQPFAGLIMDQSGHLYGTTEQGGAHGIGTVFELTPNAARTKWTETVLHTFCAEGNCTDGSQPLAGLIMDRSGHLYGTTSTAGAHGVGGTVFELTPNAARIKWTETVLYSFCAEANCTDGSGPVAGLIMDKSGHLYGTTLAGGAGAGTVFELTPNAARTQWTETVLYSFCTQANCTDGQMPEAGLIMDKSEHLYGTTSAGGAHRFGTVFELTPNAARTEWTETVLYSFCTQAGCTDGQIPEAGLIMDKSGHLYGTTSAGGVGAGTVFELTPDAARTHWTETVLHSFSGPSADGYKPVASLIMGGSGHLYGTTEFGGAHVYGTVFEVEP